MKKPLTILALLLTFISFSQSWKYSSGGDAFEGKYKTSNVKGIGTEFPYQEPQLTINKFDKSDALNFYISGAGYFQKGTNTRVLWVFDNEPDDVYDTYDYSLSSDGKTIFFVKFNINNSDEYLSNYEFINKLKNASKVTLRVSNKYSQNTLSFSLRGSTKAINFIIPEDELSLKIEKIKEQRQADNLVKNEKIILLNKLLEVAKFEKIKESSLESLKSKIKDDLGISYSGQIGTGYNYKSIKIKPTLKEVMFESYGYVDLFYELEDGSEKNIYGTWKVEMDAPIFKKIEEEKILKEEQRQITENRIKGLLEKYQIDGLKDLIFKTILEKQEFSYPDDNWDLNQLEGVTITISDYRSSRFWEMVVNIKLNGDKKIKKKIYIFSLDLTKKRLKKIGGKDSIEF